ncbi:MAG: BTAD domain-containing putative transcriptional regulator [Mycobacteriales bacterium]
MFISGTGPDAAVSPRWRLSLLGAWRLAEPHGPVDVGSNGQRLYALLALRGGCDRSYAAGVLWPDCSDRHAHGNLRATLSRLHRRRIAGPLDSSNGVLALSPDVGVDVHELMGTACAVLDGAPVLPARSTLSRLTGDDLLVGWYDDWVLLERERLRQLRLHALEALAERLLVAGALPVAVEAALAAVALEPLRESAHRALIRAHLAEGNRVAAARQLDQLRQMLRRELGEEPSRLVTDLLAGRSHVPVTGRGGR